MKQYSKELISFVNSTIFDAWDGIHKIDLETAREDIKEWVAEGYEDLPEDLTPESYMDLWNEIAEAENNNESEDATMKKYFIFDIARGSFDSIPIDASSEEEAIRKADSEWKSLSAFDRKNREEFELVETVGFDEDDYSDFVSDHVTKIVKVYVERKF